ncbi:hypothetical protein Q5P01_023569 [Channa striata]|uniref:ATP synthase subunit f, mitochondrial n=1 Tax=Channa striata TaxID=64152 RepID=A0AA88LNY0_CHASR|nr:hypothetical protein Q5P01_023569 [Channa striata]
MTSEVCPFCGKTYKRLKSHLPYCKAAASSKTHDATGEETSSSQLATASSQRKPKGKKSTDTLSVSTDLQTKKSKKVSVILSEAAQLQSQVSSSQSLSPSSTSLPLPATKKKQKLVDQIKMASMPPSATVSLVSSSPLVMCEAKNKSPRVSKEAAKSEHISKGSLKGTRSASEDLLSHLNTSTTVQTKINSVNDSMRDVGLLSDTTPQEGPRKKRSKTKKAAGSPLATKPPSDPLDVNKTKPAQHSTQVTSWWITKRERF